MLHGRVVNEKRKNIDLHIESFLNKYYMISDSYMNRIHIYNIDA